ncbi:MAG: hypothetical protein OQL06_15690 [Gammaproteobacteria bacterium]|nr:hypothetical protein [Gammaproteobacteria bacterium]
MKILSLLLLVITASCTDVESTERSWSFVQSVGGLKVGQPYTEQNIHYLPITVDVSGLQEITIKPTMLNSALMCSRTGHLVKGNEVYISIYTSSINDTANKNCSSIPLINIEEGNYTVYYNTESSEMHKLGTITISSNKAVKRDQ